jgi:hypothetical protein
MPESEIKPQFNPSLGMILEIYRFLSAGLTRARKLAIGLSD